MPNAAKTSSVLDFRFAGKLRQALMLSTPTPIGELLSQDNPLDATSLKVRKEIMRTGSYFKAADGLSFEIDTDILDHWASTCEEYLAAGNRIPVPATHYDSENPESNRGWVTGMERSGESLYAFMDLFGPDRKSIETLAAVSDVSIFVPPERVDGHGKMFVRPITHVALCTDPVIPGLEQFEVLAASHAATKKEQTMKLDLAKISAALNITEAMTEENAESLILSAAATLTGKVTAAEAKVTTAETEVATLKLSHSPKKADPVLVSLAAENRSHKLDALVSAARITPAVREKLAKHYINADTLSLSLGSGGKDGFDEIVEALKDNDPVVLGEQSGRQVLELSHPGKAAVNPVVADAERRAKEASGK